MIEYFSNIINKFKNEDKKIFLKDIFEKSLNINIVNSIELDEYIEKIINNFNFNSNNDNNTNVLNFIINLIKNDKFNLEKIDIKKDNLLKFKNTNNLKFYIRKFIYINNNINKILVTNDNNKISNSNFNNININLSNFYILYNFDYNYISIFYLIKLLLLKICNNEYIDELCYFKVIIIDKITYENFMEFSKYKLIKNNYLLEYFNYNDLFIINDNYIKSIIVEIDSLIKLNNTNEYNDYIKNLKIIKFSKYLELNSTIIKSVNDKFSNLYFIESNENILIFVFFSFKNMIDMKLINFNNDFEYLFKIYPTLNKNFNKSNFIFYIKQTYYDINNFNNSFSNNVEDTYRNYKSKYYLIFKKKNQIFFKVKINKNMKINLMSKIIKIIKFIHSKNMILRLLEPKDFLIINNNDIKLYKFKYLIDPFNNDTQLNFDINILKFNKIYISPKILNKVNHNYEYFFEYCDDIWPCLIIFFEIIFGYKPFILIEKNLLNKSILYKKVTIKYDLHKKVFDEFELIFNKEIENLDINDLIRIFNIYKNENINSNLEILYHDINSSEVIDKLDDDKMKNNFSKTINEQIDLPSFVDDKVTLPTQANIVTENIIPTSIIKPTQANLVTENITSTSITKPTEPKLFGGDSDTEYI